MFVFVELTASLTVNQMHTNDNSDNL